MSDSNLLQNVADLHSLKNSLAEIQDAISALEDLIKAEMLARDTDKLYVGDFKVLWTVYETQRLDTKALKAELPDLYDRYAKTVVARRFCVS